MKARIVRGISDSYIVKEAVETVTGEKFLEVYEHEENGNENFQGEWLCDIDGTMDDTDEYLLNEIDAAI